MKLYRGRLPTIDIQKSLVGGYYEIKKNSVAVYNRKLKTLWDQLGNLIPYPPCPRGAIKLIIDRDEKARTVHFLLGLH